MTKGKITASRGCLLTISLILALNVILPAFVYLKNIRPLRHKTSGVYNNMQKTYCYSSGFKEEYLKNPILDMSLVLLHKEVEVVITITQDTFTICQIAGGNIRRKQVLHFDDDIVCIGDNRFRCINSQLSFGQMFPGTMYSFLKCEFEIKADSLELCVIDDAIGIALFVIPVKTRKQFDLLLQSKSGGKLVANQSGGSPHIASLMK
ncbi:MAG: hypothetical protein KAI74_01380 [Kiritimatiellae bacterium]|nr:hypothetical protein [Kiritimatiellia bacterium]